MLFKLLSILAISLIMVSSCQETKQPELILSKDKMTKIARTNDDKFSVGVKTKDAKLLGDIYSDSAQYIQPKSEILVGREAIKKDWENFIALKQNPLDLVLHIHDVRGNREIIYETGDGFTLLADSSKWSFNYVNVWRIQNDGSYKLEIDTYNDAK